MTYEPASTGHTDGTTAFVSAYDPGPDGLLPQGEREQLTRRLEQAVQNFVDSPREALEMAENAFNEAAAQVTAAVAERGRALSSRWQGETTATETEELRILLRQYRETTERLLHV